MRPGSLAAPENKQVPKGSISTLDNVLLKSCSFRLMTSSEELIQCEVFPLGLGQGFQNKKKLTCDAFRPHPAQSPIRKSLSSKDQGPDLRCPGLCLQGSPPNAACVRLSSPQCNVPRLLDPCLPSLGRTQCHLPQRMPPEHGLIEVPGGQVPALGPNHTPLPSLHPP